MNTILVIIRIDQVRIFSIKFVIILKIIQNSRQAIIKQASYYALTEKKKEKK